MEAICEAEEREGAEPRIRLMESHCEELDDLANKVEKQAVSETELEPLIELGEEIEYRRENVVNLAQMLKEDMPNNASSGPMTVVGPSLTTATPATPDLRRSGWHTGRHTIPL